MKKLTRRQTEFLQQFLGLYQGAQRPLHYSEIAEKLNVKNSTAYEMLRTLEKNGLLSRIFQLPADHHGPGRATVYFQPTNETLQVYLPAAEKNLLQKEWEALTEMILEKLNTYRQQDFKKWLNEAAQQFSHNNTPYLYATKVVTAIIVSLASLRDTVGKNRPMGLLHKIGITNESGLSNLAGVGLALSLLDNVNAQLVNFISQQNEPLQKVLVNLEDQEKQQLSEFATEAFRIALG